MKKESGFVKIIAYCAMLGVSAGAVCGASFGIVWILVGSLHDPSSFSWVVLELAFAYGLGIGFLIGLAFGLVNGLAVAAIVKVFSARSIRLSDLEHIIRYTCVIVSLVGALSIYPASVELIVLEPGYAAIIAVFLGGIAWAMSYLFCRWYRKNSLPHQSTV